MMQAVAPQDWGDYVPGLFPSNISNVKVTGPLTLTMTMDKAYNPTWFTDNELSQLTPMPMAWDKTASGPSDCTAVVADCAKVYSYLDSQSKSLSTWVSSPMLVGRGRPVEAGQLQCRRQLHVRPQPGLLRPGQADPGEVRGTPVHDRERRVQRAAGRAPPGGQKIDVGYIPTTDAPTKPANATVGANPVNGYTLAPLIQWAINYFPINFQSTTGNGPVIKQLYFRQALQYLMNQKAVINGPLHGYGAYTVGPVGTYPATPYLSPRASRVTRSRSTRPRPSRC